MLYLVWSEALGSGRLSRDPDIARSAYLRVQEIDEKAVFRPIPEMLLCDVWYHAAVAAVNSLEHL